MAENEDGCGGKHLRLTFLIIGLVAFIVVGAVLYAAGVASGKADAGDVKELRNQVVTIDKTNSRVDERLKNIEENLRWVRTKLEGSKP